MEPMAQEVKPLRARLRGGAQAFRTLLRALQDSFGNLESAQVRMHARTPIPLPRGNMMRPSQPAPQKAVVRPYCPIEGWKSPTWPTQGSGKGRKFGNRRPMAGPCVALLVLSSATAADAGSPGLHRARHMAACYAPGRWVWNATAHPAPAHRRQVALQRLSRGKPYVCRWAFSRPVWRLRSLDPGAMCTQALARDALESNWGQAFGDGALIVVVGDSVAESIANTLRIVAKANPSLGKLFVVHANHPFIPSTVKGVYEMLNNTRAAVDMALESEPTAAAVIRSANRVLTILHHGLWYNDGPKMCAVAAMSNRQRALCQHFLPRREASVDHDHPVSDPAGRHEWAGDLRGYAWVRKALAVNTTTAHLVADTRTLLDVLRQRSSETTGTGAWAPGHVPGPVVFAEEMPQHFPGPGGYFMSSMAAMDVSCVDAINESAAEENGRNRRAAMDLANSLGFPVLPFRHMFRRFGSDHVGSVRPLQVKAIRHPRSAHGDVGHSRVSDCTHYCTAGNALMHVATAIINVAWNAFGGTDTGAPPWR